MSQQNDTKAVESQVSSSPIPPIEPATISNGVFSGALLIALRVLWVLLERLVLQLIEELRETRKTLGRVALKGPDAHRSDDDDEQQ